VKFRMEKKITADGRNFRKEPWKNHPNIICIFQEQKALNEIIWANSNCMQKFCWMASARDWGQNFYRATTSETGGA
jgi:hypothetical protein